MLTKRHSNWTFHTLLVGYKSSSHFAKVWPFLLKSNIPLLLYDPAILLLDAYLNELKTYSHRKISMQTITAALFTNTVTFFQRTQACPDLGSLGKAR